MARDQFQAERAAKRVQRRLYALVRESGKLYDGELDRVLSSLMCERVAWESMPATDWVDLGALLFALGDDAVRKKVASARTEFLERELGQGRLFQVQT